MSQSLTPGAEGDLGGEQCTAPSLMFVVGHTHIDDCPCRPRDLESGRLVRYSGIRQIDLNHTEPIS
ncbi:MAG: hypothetical protein L6R40_006327 [Gallowayella cf. fulva]|nr:MAG: hypothetical protein L6R40_006327 [Xanthomendoza cf. fulva]